MITIKPTILGVLGTAEQLQVTVMDLQQMQKLLGLIGH
jgi:hypothetical protein